LRGAVPTPEWVLLDTAANARGLRNLIDHDHPELSVSRQCLLPGLARSTLYYRLVPVREATLRVAPIWLIALDGIC
jgi:hypothetical protein